MILSIKDVRKNFGGIKALDGLTLKIQKQGVYALIGPNGSGKTTLFNVISGLEKPDSGIIKMKGVDKDSSTHILSKYHLSRTFQQPQLFNNLTIADHLEIALHQDDEKLLRVLFRSRDTDEKRANSALELVGLEKSLTTTAGELSYGQRKLLEIAIAVAKPHKILLFDEPVAGVNPQLRKKLRDVIGRLSRQGETIFFIEHDMNFVMDLADHVFVMDDGRMIMHGTADEVRENPKVLEAYLGK